MNQFAEADKLFDQEDRRQGGIYYTSRENIQKVINPLFMDDLEAESAIGSL